jgi:hypothetical protein
MRKHERAKDAVGFLEKEAEAIKGLVRSYIQREQPPQGEVRRWCIVYCLLFIV